MEILAGEGPEEAIEWWVTLCSSILEGGCQVNLLKGIGDAGRVRDCQVSGSAGIWLLERGCGEGRGEFIWVIGSGFETVGLGNLSFERVVWEE